MRRITLFFIIFLTHFVLFAQSVKNFGWYNQQTYNLYLAKDWSQLIVEGEEAIEAGIDFYYLRMRIGIAYYEKGAYRNAIPHFRKALVFYDQDPLSSEYLYYAYKFSGRTQDANLTYTKYRKLLQGSNVDSGFGFITGIYTEGGLKFLSPSSETVGALKYFHIGAQQQLGSRLSLYHGYMRVSRSFSNLDPPNFVQNEYYFKATIPIITGLQAMGSFHSQAVVSSTQYTNLAFWGGLNANTKLIDFSFNYGRAQINNTTQQQISTGVLIYPTPTQNLYLQSVFTYHFDDSQGNVIFYQKIGARVGKRTWLDVYGSFGDMRNVQDMDGFYLYNVADPLVMRLGTTANIYLGSRAKLLIGYTFESFEVIDTNFPYKQHYLFTGLQFLLKK